MEPEQTENYLNDELIDDVEELAAPPELQQNAGQLQPPQHKRTIWKIAPGWGASLWEQCLERECITVRWSDAIPDFNTFVSKDEIKQALRDDRHGVGVSATCIWRFTHEVQQGDIVVATQGEHRIKGVGVVTSDYIPPDQPENPMNGTEYRHTRRVNWLIKQDLNVLFTLSSLSVNKLQQERWEQIKQAYTQTDPTLHVIFQQLEQGGEQGLVPVMSAVNLKEQFDQFCSTPFHRLVIAIRQKRAQQLRHLLSNPDAITLEIFNREVWPITNTSYLNGTEISGLLSGEHSLTPEQITELQHALVSDSLELHGNYIWGSATKVFYASFKDDALKTSYIRQAVTILNDPSLQPIEKAEQIIAIPGFGRNSATGLVMVFHPADFAIYNTQSQQALQKLGLAADTLPAFEESIQALKEQVRASDYITLDWFLYNRPKQIHYWWVNQGATYDRERQGEYLWASQLSQQGRRLAHHETMTRLNPGDIVLHYSGQAIRAVSQVVQPAQETPRPGEFSEQDRVGYLARVQYYDLAQPITLDEIPLEWRTMPIPSGPFTRQGTVRETYLTQLADAFMTKFVEQFSDRLPALLMNQNRRVVKIAPGEKSRFWDDCLANDYICVGWDEIGDLRHFDTKEDFKQAFANQYAQEYNNNKATITTKANELWTLRELQPADLVVANRGTSEVLAVGTVLPAGYDWYPERKEFKHIVHVRWDTSYARPIPVQAAWAFTTVSPVSDELYRLIMQKEITPAIWLFQAVPQVYNLAEEIKNKRVGDTDSWLVTAHRQDMKPGDPVILWQGGGQAGIYGIGELIKSPYQRPAQITHPDSQVEWAVDFRYTHILQEPVSKERLLQDSILQHMHIIRLPRGTNFRVSVQEWDALQKILTQLSFTDIYQKLLAQEIYFTSDLLANYLLALQTKRFVILTGISGTGKTQIALAIARLFGQTPVFNQEMTRHQNAGKGHANFAVIPVRPDWTDNRGLLGFYNPILDRYTLTPFLQLLLSASDEFLTAQQEKRPARPYFAILDEMNLARVEHYFSDLLSSIESGEPIHLHDRANVTEAGFTIPQQLTIPDNLFITGTVNIDETTYMFSPKVIDRAFTIELDHVDLAAFGNLTAELSNANTSYLFLKDFPGLLRYERRPAKGDWDALTQFEDGKLSQLIIATNTTLQTHHRHFGYRVAVEIARFVTLAAEQAGDAAPTLRAALDLALLEKVLPKFHGTRQELEQPLKALEQLLNPDTPEADRQPDDVPVVSGEERTQFPRTTAKIKRMRARLQQQGFTSFIE